MADRRRNRLGQLMQDCAQAVYDDSEMTINGNGVNSVEAMIVLEAVAEILNMEGPEIRQIRLFESDLVTGTIDVRLNQARDAHRKAVGG